MTGETYVGFFKDGKKNGVGQSVYKTGKMYKGQLKNGQ